jgi:hypothetical protein
MPDRPRWRLLRDAVEHDFLTRPNFQPVAAVGSLEEEDVVARQPQYALDRSGHVFVQAVGKFNDYYGAAAWRSHEATGDNATTLAPKLPKHHIHNNQPSTRFQAGKGLQGTAPVFQSDGAKQACRAAPNAVRLHSRWLFSSTRSETSLPCVGFADGCVA